MRLEENKIDDEDGQGNKISHRKNDLNETILNYLYENDEGNPISFLSNTGISHRFL